MKRFLFLLIIVFMLGISVLSPLPASAHSNRVNSHVTPASFGNCWYNPSPANCNNQDPIAQGCTNNAYLQTPVQSDAQSEIDVWWSPTCKSNWIVLSGKNGNVISYAELEESAYSLSQTTCNNLDGGSGEACPLSNELEENVPNTTHWYTNMLYAPTNAVRGCGSFTTGSSGEFWCTSWH